VRSVIGFQKVPRPPGGTASMERGSSNKSSDPGIGNVRVARPTTSPAETLASSATGADQAVVAEADLQFGGEGRQYTGTIVTNPAIRIRRATGSVLSAPLTTTPGGPDVLNATGREKERATGLDQTGAVGHATPPITGRGTGFVEAVARITSPVGLNVSDVGSESECSFLVLVFGETSRYVGWDFRFSPMCQQHELF